MTGQPFAAVRVLDFTRFPAGPFGSYQLALLGADVIKIEPREGKEMRQTQAEALWAERKLSPSWLSVNGNKRSLTPDLRKPEATAIVKRLAAGVDVVWENFRPGVMTGWRSARSNALSTIGFCRSGRWSIGSPPRPPSPACAPATICARGWPPTKRSASRNSPAGEAGAPR